MPPRTIIIKKYENRRLYDTSNSRYVNLEDIAQLLRDGNDVQVVDATTGEDLTRLILTQIIAENAKAPDSAFPLDMLRQMVIDSGRMGQQGMLGYMKALSQMYQDTYRTFVPGAPFAFTERKPDPAEEPQPSPPDAAESIEELRRRIEDLERMVELNAGDKAASKKRAPRRKQR